MVSKFTQVAGSPEFYYQPPTNESFGAGPPGVVDPFERKSVRIAKSSVPESGEGVFAVRDFPEVKVTKEECTRAYIDTIFEALVRA